MLAFFRISRYTKNRDSPMAAHRLSARLTMLKKAVYRIGIRFFSDIVLTYLRTEITSTTKVANAIIRYSVSKTLMLITSLS